MTQYQIKTNGLQVLIHTVDNFGNDIWFPENSANTDYQAYLAWVAEGNTAEEWEG